MYFNRLYAMSVGLNYSRCLYIVLFLALLMPVSLAKSKKPRNSTTSDKDYEFEWDYFPSICIAIAGTITNTLSLSYFVRKPNPGIGNKMFILLNSIDVVVCLSTAVKAVLRYFVRNSEEFSAQTTSVSYETWVVFYTMFSLVDGVAVESTGLVTCVLSVTRSVGLLYPFYKPNGKAITASFITFLIYLLIREIIRAVLGIYPRYVNQQGTGGGKPNHGMYIDHTEYFKIAGLHSVFFISYETFL